MKINYYYVIYLLTFENGQYYIGKASDFNERMEQHRRGNFNGVNLKELVVILNMEFDSKILCVAPCYLCNDDKQIWMDNMERTIIHNEAKKVYDEITGENSMFDDYQPYKEIVNVKLVNTQLY